MLPEGIPSVNINNNMVNTILKFSSSTAIVEFWYLVLNRKDSEINQGG
jgi:hypothetical protein